MSADRPQPIDVEQYDASLKLKREEFQQQLEEQLTPGVIALMGSEIFGLPFKRKINVAGPSDIQLWTMEEILEGGRLSIIQGEKIKRIGLSHVLEAVFDLQDEHFSDLDDTSRDVSRNRTSFGRVLTNVMLKEASSPNWIHLSELSDERLGRTEGDHIVEVLSNINRVTASVKVSGMWDQVIDRQGALYHRYLKEHWARLANNLRANAELDKRLTKNGDSVCTDEEKVKWDNSVNFLNTVFKDVCRAEDFDALKAVARKHYGDEAVQSTLLAVFAKTLKDSGMKRLLSQQPPSDIA